MRLLDREFTDRYRDSNILNSVIKTQLISIKHIALEDLAAEHLLYIASYSDQQRIPFVLLGKAFDYCVAALSDIGKEDCSSDKEGVDDRVYKALSYLQRFSFLQEQTMLGSQDRMYDMHQLVSTATRRHLQEQSRSELMQSALKVIADNFPNGGYETWSKCRLYHAYAFCVCQMAKESKYCTLKQEIMLRCSSYLSSIQKFSKVAKSEVQIVELQKQLLGLKHPTILLCISSLILAYASNGQLGEAEKLYRRVYEVRKEVLGLKHLDTISSLEEIALVYQELDQQSKVEKIYKQVIELRKEVLGPKHPRTLKSLDDLASTYYRQDQYDAAAKLQEQVLELRKEVLGPKHPDTLASIVSLAETYTHQGRESEAAKF